MNEKGIKVLQVAIGELGNIEFPADSNLQKYGEWYNLNGYAWCAMFVSWCFDQAGTPLGKIETPKGYAGCQGGYNWFKKFNQVISGKNARPGDIVFFDWQGDAKFDHTGLFMQDAGDGINFFSIEGNTAIGNDSNGGEVMIRLRKYRQASFVHPSVYDK